MAKVFWSGCEGVFKTFWHELSGMSTETGNSLSHCLYTVLEAPCLLALAYYTEKLF